ncbi:hypothetical protein N7532_011070 [Penicillium argentinense]|uniref:C2H2-type domain-containing protein n=1 Tax=Penicillium argentinense TaxID=1131581 RepID=A0A9W9EHU6_9EURO|nr:uncharacterized protein N7532_011070 [Penicillium argentinense]KAJ5082027.1 hypothetical protein N7532_011070 [Penicillium argentinense]
MEEPQTSWQDSNDVLQGIMVGQDTHHSEIDFRPSLGMDSSNSLLDLHLNTDLGLDNTHANQSAFLGPWPSASSQSFYYPHYPARMTGGQDAWNPLQVTGVPDPNPSTMSHMNVSGGEDYAFQKPHYRTPSDSGSQCMGSFVSDSGYGSNATQSVVASSYGLDSSPHLGGKEHGFAESGSFFEQGGANVFVRDYGEQSFESVRCDDPGCSWIGKCPSDKRKHEARHRKLFKCDEPNCPRKEGFGTINDLARHKKCVHNKEPERGPKMMYLCFGKNCPRPNKRWPRLDNFKQHLSRMHHDENAEALLKKSMDWYESITGHRGQKLEDSVSLDASTMETQEEIMSIHSAELDLDASNTYHNQESVDFLTSRAQTPKSFHVPHMDAPTGNLPSQASTLNALGLSPALTNENRDLSTERSTPNPETFVADAADNLINAMTKKMNNRARRPSHHSDEGIELEENPNLSIPQRQMLQKVLLAALERLSDNASAAPEPADDKQDWFQCDICSKRTRLRCEMKKHQKRHERPYGCTFPHCAKSFGSKADWKRHESSQHLHVASWLCARHDPSKNGACGRVFYREETYVQHLGQQHRLPKTRVRSALLSTRLDLAGQSSYWCGFCRREVPLTSAGAAALDERFNHIDSEHFKKGERGVDWCFSFQGVDVANASNQVVEQGMEGRRKRRCSGL